MRIARLIALSTMAVVLGGCFDSSGSADSAAETGADAQPPAPPGDERPPNEEPPSPTPRPDTPPTLDAGAPGCPDDGARAVEVTDSAQLIGGSRVARGQVGDFLIENDQIRALIRQPGREHHGTVNPYGGTIVDADICREQGVRERSNFENSALGINIETIPHYTDVTILNDGRNGEPAVIRATGPVDLFEYANPSSIIRDMGLQFPDHADDQPLPVEVQTDYILEPGDNYVREHTTIFNLSDERQDIYLVEYLSGSGFVDAFIPGTGFGEPLATTSCPATKYVPCDDGMCDPCNFLAFAGYDDARGVSYGRIHPYQGSSSMNVTGINIVAYGTDILPVVLGLDSPNFSIPGDGELEVERYFAVTGGSVGEIQSVRNEIFGFEVGNVEGVVTDDRGDPVDAAKVAVVRENQDLELFAVDDPDLKALISGIRPDRVLSTGSSVLGNLLDGQLPDGTVGTALAPELDVVAQTVTDDQGRYDIELSPGDYQVLVFRENYGEPSPEQARVTISDGVERTRDFSLPGPGKLELQVTDENGRPVPAKVQLVGYPANQPLANHQNIFGQLEAQAGVFFDQFVRDPLPDGIAFVDFVGADGRLEATQVPEGEYELVVSHGPQR